MNCGKPKVRMLPLKLNIGAQKSGQMIQLEMNVPLCAECAKKEDRIANVTWLPFFILGEYLAGGTLGDRLIPREQNPPRGDPR